MIYGIGTDIVQISRIEAALARHGERFAAKILGPEEMIKFRARRARSEVRGMRFLATRFSAKEAFSKAIGLGVRHPMSWHSLQIMSDEIGGPHLRWQGELAVWMSERNLCAHLSMSDEDEFAIAYVIVEKRMANSAHE